MQRKTDSKWTQLNLIRFGLTVNSVTGTFLVNEGGHFDQVYTNCAHVFLQPQPGQTRCDWKEGVVFAFCLFSFSSSASALQWWTTITTPWNWFSHFASLQLIASKTGHFWGAYAWNWRREKQEKRLSQMLQEQEFSFVSLPGKMPQWGRLPPSLKKVLEVFWQRSLASFLSALATCQQKWEKLQRFWWVLKKVPTPLNPPASAPLASS